MRTILGLLFFIALPWLLLAAIPLVFGIIELGACAIPFILAAWTVGYAVKKAF